MRISEATQPDFHAAQAVARRSLHLDGVEGGDLVALLWAREDQHAVIAKDAEDATETNDAEGGDVVGVALGSLQGTRGHVDLIAIAPEHRGHGHGRALLQGLEQRLVEAGARELWIGGTVDRYAWPGVDVRYTPAVCLVESAGYSRVDEAVSMSVDLRSAPLTSDESTDFDVRRLDPAERADFAAYMQRWEGSWPAEAGRAAAFEVPRVHVASDASGYLGFACHGANRDSWFGPMGTEEAARGRGIGGILLRRCLADQRAAGMTHAEIGWVGPVPFYAKTVGAYVDRVCWLYRREI